MLRIARAGGSSLQSVASLAALARTTALTIGVAAPFARAFAAPPFRRPSGGGGSTQQRPSNQQPRKGTPERITRPTANGGIRHDPIRVIDKAGNHVGIVPLREGLAMAKAAGADLIVITDTAVPPVCRIMSLREHLSDLQQAAVDRRRAQRRAEPKEIRLTARTDGEASGVGEGFCCCCCTRRVPSSLPPFSLQLTTWESRRPRSSTSSRTGAPSPSP